MADVINFEKPENSISNYDFEELEGLIYEQRLVNPETGEAIVIASGPAKEIVALAMNMAEDVPNEVFEDTFEGMEKYMSKEFLKSL